MEHPSEHSIELYVLQGRTESGDTERLEAHLKQCAGCSSLAEAASSFYADLRVDLLTRPSGPPSVSRNLPVAPGRMPAIFETPFREAALSRVLPVGPVWRFVRRHPYVTGGGMLSLLGGLALLMITFNLLPSRDLNPGTVILNHATSTLDAYNRSGERLWTLPVPHLDGFISHEGTDEWKYVQLTDLNGDGRNEIVTTLPFGPGEKDFATVVHVLDRDRNEIATIRPGETIRYGGRIYPDQFFITGLATGDFSGTGKKDIVVTANHLHSPSIVSRFDAEGNRLGTFLHFGSLTLMGIAPQTDGPRKIFVLYGASDADEGTNMAVLVGIDPALLTGESESSFSGGFGLPRSPAEMFYVQVPPTEVAKAYGARVQFVDAKPVRLNDGEAFHVLVGAQPDSLHLFLEYIFRPDFSVLEVKSENATKALYDRLTRRGRVAGNFYDDYMKVVARELRYWDGRRWQADPTPVAH